MRSLINAIENRIREFRSEIHRVFGFDGLRDCDLLRLRVHCQHTATKKQEFTCKRVMFSPITGMSSWQASFARRMYGHAVPALAPAVAFRQAIRSDG